METKNQIKHILFLSFMCGAIGFASCSGGEESIDDVLSKETTPITFELDVGWEHLLFDYTTNDKFVESKAFTIKSNDSQQATTINLRQGKHKLIWLKGLRRRYLAYGGGDYLDTDGLNFVSENKSLVRDDGLKSLQHSVFYCEKDLEVTKSLMTTQKLSYTPVTCVFEIVMTDANTWLSNKYSFGKMSFPFVSEVGLTDNRYTIGDEPYYITLYAYDFRNSYYNGHQVITPELPAGYENTINSFTNLCPLNGLENIQLKANVIDENGQPVSTTPLPKISLRRGYTTKLTGPLFSGSMADWKVEMVAYEGYWY